MGAFVGEKSTAEMKRYGLRAMKLACARQQFAPPGGNDPNSQQAISEIYMARLWQSCDLVRGWRLLHRTPIALFLPDALVCDAAGPLLHAVVYATHWCECIVGRFHKLCSSRGVAYQIYGA